MHGLTDTYIFTLGGLFVYDRHTVVLKVRNNQVVWTNREIYRRKLFSLVLKRLSNYHYIKIPAYVRAWND